MSEFSESFHLRAKDERNGINLLEQAGHRGVVFKPVNDWVTIIPQADLLQAVNTLVSKIQGTLLHYVYGEDHGWDFSIYEGSKKVIHLRV